MNIRNLRPSSGRRHLRRAMLAPLAASVSLLATAAIPAVFPQPSAAAQTQTGNLRIEKSVKSSEYDPDAEFLMTVRLVPHTGQSVGSTLSYIRETVETLSGKVSVSTTDGSTPASGSMLTATIDRTVGNLASVLDTDRSYEWHRVANGTDTIVGDGKQTYAITDVDAGSDIYMVVSDASGKHVGTVKSDTVTVERPATARYAVRIIGIGTDTGRDGDVLGLTFGPATGASYAASHVEHTPTGTDTAGNAHRCVHDDDWTTIAEWSRRDPQVYEQCLDAGCTRSVPLAMGSKLGASGYQDKTGADGDGASVLFDSVATDYRSWNGAPGGYDAAGGWQASYIRRTLNGKGRTDAADGADTMSAKPQRGAVLDDADSMYAAMPSEIRDAIVPRATRSDADYDKVDGSSTVTTYDALWLPSMVEVGQGTREHEGSKYAALTKFGLAGYKEGGASGSWWLRSVATLWDTSVYYILRGGSWSLYQSYGAGEAGLSFCFSLAGPQTTSGAAGKMVVATAKAAGNASKESVGNREGKATRHETVEVKDGTFVISIKGNESVTISGIPEGMGYVVTEDTPIGWVGDGSEGTTGVIGSDATAVARFSNVRKQGTGQATLSATKTLDGNPTGGGAFEFVLSDETGTVLQTVRNADGGGIAFSPIEYTKAGAYRYQMSEKAGDDGNVEYDARTVGVVVTVSDNGNISVSYDRVPRFENRSKGTAGDSSDGTDDEHTFVPVITKVLDGGELAAGQFEFEMTDANGDVISTARNDETGRVEFSPVNMADDADDVTDASHHAYAIREVNDGQDGIEYDRTVVTLVVGTEADGHVIGTYKDSKDAVSHVASSGASGWQFTNHVRGSIVQTGDGMRVVVLGIIAAGIIGGVSLAWRIAHRGR